MKDLIQYGLQCYVKLTSIGCQFAGNNILHSKYTILEICMCRAIKIKCKHKFMIVVKLFETC